MIMLVGVQQISVQLCNAIICEERRYNFVLPYELLYVAEAYRPHAFGQNEIIVGLELSGNYCSLSWCDESYCNIAPLKACKCHVPDACI